jgi:hypothetical protein
MEPFMIYAPVKDDIQGGESVKDLKPISQQFKEILPETRQTIRRVTEESRKALREIFRDINKRRWER